MSLMDDDGQLSAVTKMNVERMSTTLFGSILVSMDLLHCSMSFNVVPEGISGRLLGQSAAPVQIHPVTSKMARQIRKIFRFATSFSIFGSAKPLPCRVSIWESRRDQSNRT